jgi:hypothetical protein
MTHDTSDDIEAPSVPHDTEELMAELNELLANRTPLEQWLVYKAARYMLLGDSEQPH